MDKSYKFGLRVLQITDVLALKKHFTVSGQLSRSGTAIGALSREGQRAESDKDFVHKLGMALKEADETQYWTDLAGGMDYITEEEYEELYSGAEELIKLLVSIIKSKKRNMS